MTPGASDAHEVRAAQHRNWDAAAAGWKAWSAFNERAAAHISARLVELAEVRPGSRVLDVAAGYGEPALTAAWAAGPGGRVVATDISAEMLDFARERAVVSGITTLEFLQADAASLAFAPASFDAAVSRWGIIFEPDAEAALQRVRGFLEPGARIAISSWGPAERVPFLWLPMATTTARLGLTPPPSGAPGPLSRTTPASLAALLNAGGFGDVVVEEHEVVYAFDSPAHFTDYVRAIAAPVRAMIRDHAGADREGAWDAITRAAAEHSGGNGPLRLSNAVLIASGTA
ncbi:MAG: methyltransferase protein [Solirubrobacterales bacterium]|nr:methyltransferase protein [Solirubrobacterales bacterium]